MAITYDVARGEPFLSFDSVSEVYFGLSSDIKPTTASHSGLPVPATGSLFIETDTGKIFATYNGTDWIIIGAYTGGAMTLTAAYDAAKTAASPAQVNAEADTALNTIVPASPTAGSINDILSKAAGGNTFNKSTDSLEALADSMLKATSKGVIQEAATTIDLNQAAATYDLLTGATQVVILESLVIQMPVGAAGGALTSISIQTNDATAQVLISAVQGAVANLTSENQLVWTGKVRIGVGKKIQLTIGGGAHGSGYVCNVNAEYRAVVDGGTLS